MKRSNRDEHLDRIADDASAWFERLQDSEPGSSDREAFAVWLKASAEHVHEFLQIAALRANLGDLGEDPEVDALIREARTSGEENIVQLFDSSAGPATEHSIVRQRNVPAGWLAAGMASIVFVLSAAAFTLFGVVSDGGVFQTRIGEQISFPLPDGTVVTLNTLSTIEPRFTGSHRDIVLTSGEALFDVVSDPNRPFRVIAGNTVVEAIGTTFNVYHRHADTTVTVVEGTVEVRSSDSEGLLPGSTAPPDGPVRLASVVPQPLIVTVGQQARLDAHTGQTTLVEASLERATAWRDRRLFFDGKLLVDVIDEFNLYNNPPMVIADPDIGRLPITGSFNANDRASFVLFLERSGIANAQVEADGRISLESGDFDDRADN